MKKRKSLVVGFNDIPMDVLFCIFGYFNCVEDQLSVMQTSKKMHGQISLYIMNRLNNITSIKRKFKILKREEKKIKLRNLVKNNKEVWEYTGYKECHYSDWKYGYFPPASRYCGIDYLEEQSEKWVNGKLAELVKKKDDWLQKLRKSDKWYDKYDLRRIKERNPLFNIHV